METRRGDTLGRPLKTEAETGSEAATSQGAGALPATSRRRNGAGKAGLSPGALEGSTEDVWCQNSERMSFCSFKSLRLQHHATHST